MLQKGLQNLFGETIFFKATLERGLSVSFYYLS